MMRTWHLYDPASGLFDGRRFASSDPFAIEANRHGMGAIEGVIDPESQRVDVATGALVDYKPPPPDENHVWIESDPSGRRVRRWVLSPAVVERRRREAEIRAELVALDARLLRPLAERDDEGEEADTARAIIDAIKKQKAALRAELRELTAIQD